MKVTPGSLPGPLADSDPNRSQNILHASDIYNAYYAALDKEDYSDIDPDMLFAEGLAWERYLEPRLIALGIQCFRPGEQMAEWKGKPIAFSPDLVITNGRDRLGEIKKTWKSSRLRPDDKKFQKYLTQGKLYGYWMGMQDVTYFINHTVGDWGSYRFPQMRVWDIQFTKRELKDELALMMRFAEQEDLFAKAEAGLLRNPESLPQSSGKRARHS